MSPWRIALRIHEAISRAVLGPRLVRRTEEDKDKAAGRLRDLDEMTSALEERVSRIAEHEGLVVHEPSHKR